MALAVKILLDTFSERPFSLSRRRTVSSLSDEALAALDEVPLSLVVEGGLFLEEELLVPPLEALLGLWPPRSYQRHSAVV